MTEMALCAHREYEDLPENMELVEKNLGFFANLVQYPHAMNMSGPDMKCLLRKGLVWSSKAAHPLLPTESLRTHLFPTSEECLVQTGVSWPFRGTKSLMDLGSGEVDLFSLAGNGMVLPVVGAVMLCLVANLKQHPSNNSGSE